MVCRWAQVSIKCATDWAVASEGRAQRTSRLRSDACCDKVMWRVLLKRLVGAVKSACREAKLWNVDFPSTPVPRPSHTALPAGLLRLKAMCPEAP